jgi:hypothetical protein
MKKIKGVDKKTRRKTAFRVKRKKVKYVKLNENGQKELTVMFYNYFDDIFLYDALKAVSIEQWVQELKKYGATSVIKLNQEIPCSEDCEKIPFKIICPEDFVERIRKYAPEILTASSLANISENRFLASKLPSKFIVRKAIKKSWYLTGGIAEVGWRISGGIKLHTGGAR